MTPQGTRQRQLTRPSGRVEDTPLAFSPNGRTILFWRGGPYVDTQALFVMRADGSRQRQVTAVGGFWAGFSPDGRKIVFSNGRIYVINVDGTHLHRLARAFSYSEAPSFSPDGRKILFSAATGNDTQLFVMNTDGSHVHQLTYHISQAFNEWTSEADFSPDGRRIVFASSRGGGGGLYVMNANGSGMRRLTTTAFRDSQPRFSPNGHEIAFTRTITFGTGDGSGAERNETWLMNADGSHARRISTSQYGDFGPVWQPLPPPL